MAFDLSPSASSREVCTYFVSPDEGASFREEQRVHRLHAFRYTVFAPQRVALVVWDTPSKMNPLDPLSVWELFLLYEHLGRCEDIDSVVWTGSGCAFCSGLSGTYMADYAPGTPAEALLPAREVCDGYSAARKGTLTDCKRDGASMDVALKGLSLVAYRFPKLSVCAMNGVAVGGGANVGFLLHDFVFCGASGKYRYPFTELGVTAEVGSSWLLPRKVGMQRAKELLWTGRWFSAKEALDWGLAHRVCADDTLVQSALKFASEELGAGRSVPAMLEMKKLMHRFAEAGDGVDDTLQEALRLENRAFSDMAMSADTAARMDAWRRKFRSKL